MMAFAKKRIAAVVALAFALTTISCLSERDSTEPVLEAGDCRIPLSAIGANKTIVTIRNFAFFPDTVRIRRGTEVIWVNCETSIADFHTSTSDSDGWDSGALNRGEFFAATFADAGSFGYFCEPHPFMRGAVIVQ